MLLFCPCSSMAATSQRQRRTSQAAPRAAPSGSRCTRAWPAKFRSSARRPRCPWCLAWRWGTAACSGSALKLRCGALAAICCSTAQQLGTGGQSTLQTSGRLGSCFSRFALHLPVPHPSFFNSLPSAGGRPGGGGNARQGSNEGRWRGREGRRSSTSGNPRVSRAGPAGRHAAARDAGAGGRGRAKPGHDLPLPRAGPWHA